MKREALPHEYDPTTKTVTQLRDEIRKAQAIVHGLYKTLPDNLSAMVRAEQSGDWAKRLTLNAHARVAANTMRGLTARAELCLAELKRMSAGASPRSMHRVYTGATERSVGLMRFVTANSHSSVRRAEERILSAKGAVPVDVC